MLKGTALISQLRARQMELATGRLKVVALGAPEGIHPANRDVHTEAMAELLRDAAAALEARK